MLRQTTSVTGSVIVPVSSSEKQQKEYENTN